ncbi:MAG: hypothetical protein BYD32DRAFT_458115 [Podila humilis]|nr:MAG: hypothetical protein BYD32DRAFT_458115 [Podila humilis]
MLKAQENMAGQQMQQSAQHQKRASKETAKATGNNTINLLKATTKVLAFLNPVGRKTQSSDIVEQEEREQYQYHQNLVQNIADNSRHHRQHRGPILEGFEDDSVEMFKHVFQNRPINNLQSHNTTSSNGTVQQQSDNAQYNRVSYPTQPNQIAGPQSAHTQSEQVTISEADQQYAKEQLRIVRRNLRNHPPESVYFQRFAPLADDWRNFLPCSNDSYSSQDGRGLGSNYNTNIAFEWVETAYGHLNTQAAVSSFSAKWKGPQDSREDFFDAHSTVEDDSDDEYSVDWESGEERQESQRPPLSSEVPTRILYGIPVEETGSSTSFVKELLREEELCRLVTAARLGAQNDTSSTRFGPKTRIARDREEKSIQYMTDYGTFLDSDEAYASLFYQNQPQRADMDLDDGSDANDADADEVAVLTGSRLQKKGGKSRGTRTKRARQHRSSVTKSLQSLKKNDLRKLGYSSNKVTRRHAPGIGFSDVRNIESEFVLDLEDSSEENGSEDSLSYLIADYEYEDESSRAHARVGKPFKAMATVVPTRKEEVAICPSSSPDCSSSLSPNSTLLESSQESETASGMSSAASSKQDQPPKYVLREHDKALVLPSCDSDAGLSKHEIQASHKQLNALREREKEAMPTQTDSKNGLKNGLTVQTISQTLGGIAPGALSAFESRPVGSQHSLTKCNSTSSLYIDSTMLKNDVDETLRAVATVLYDKVLESHRKNDCRTERIVNSSSYVASERVVMTQADIFDFMRFIFDCGQNLGAENAIITLIYVERMTDLGNLAFHAINWRRLLLGALILSIKVWEDLAVFNSDVCAIFEGLSVKDVNALERFSMAKLQYNVSVKRSVYATYYFRLRDVSEAQHNLHYGKLTLSMSQRDMALARNDSCMSSANGSCSGLAQHQASCSSSSRSSRNGSAHGSATGGLMGMGMVGMAPKVPVGPGYRKWTLKPLSVREADKLEARSSMFCSNTMMEEQERKDAGCFWDEYTAMGRASPGDLTISSSISSSIAGSSMYTISSSTSNMAAQDSLAGGAGGAASVSASNLANKKSEPAGSEPVKRVLRLKKSRSDFFFQNSTPASIM